MRDVRPRREFLLSNEKTSTWWWRRKDEERWNGVPRGVAMEGRRGRVRGGGEGDVSRHGSARSKVTCKGVENRTSNAPWGWKSCECASEVVANGRDAHVPSRWVNGWRRCSRAGVLSSLASPQTLERFVAFDDSSRRPVPHEFELNKRI